jgi:sec-independent protein translocase protein TatB
MHQSRERFFAMFLFILDSLGSTELLVILGAALIFFGPRRLPQLSRQLGKSLAEFRRASEDFKRTWEREVNLENLEKGPEPGSENSILEKATERLRAAREVAANQTEAAPTEIAPSVTPADPLLVQQHIPQVSSDAGAAPPESPKQEWL